MSDAELFADTNRLLNLVLEADRQRHEEAEKRMAKIKESSARVMPRFSDAVQAQLKEARTSLSEGPAEESDPGSLMKSVNERARAIAEEARDKERRFKDELLQEMATQSELLRRIAKKLGC
jgi:hypothetical protein